MCCASNLVDGWCPRCLSDLRGSLGDDLARISADAATALRARRSVIAQMPRVQRPVAQPVTAPEQEVATLDHTVLDPTVLAAKPGESSASGTTLQSVLAVTGAGLFAVAATVFTFFNPDIADRVLRSVIVGLVTLVFLGGAWLLARRDLRFSAEAVGALGLVFAALDVWAFSQLAPPGVSPWWFAAAATLVGSLVLAIAGELSRIRAWQVTALIGLSAVPAMLGFAVGTPLGAALGFVGTAFAATLTYDLVPAVTGLRRGRALPSGLQRNRDRREGAPGLDQGTISPTHGAERYALIGIQLLAVSCGFLLAWSIFSVRDVSGVVSASVTFAALAVHGMLATRWALPRFWSVVAGLNAVLAVALTPTASFAVGASFAEASPWLLTSTTAATAAALVLLALLPLPWRTRRVAALIGGASILLICSLSPVVEALSNVLGASELSRYMRPMGGDLERLSASLIALVLIATAPAGIGAISRRRGTGLRVLANIADSAAMGFAFLALLCVIAAPPIWLPVRIATAIITATTLGFLLRHSVAVRQLRHGLRAQLIIAAHLAILLGILASWENISIVPVTGVVGLVALAMLASAAESSFKFLYVGSGYAYGLGIAAVAFAQLGLGGVQQLSLVTSLGLLGAIAATFLRRIGPRAWYAILTVTLLPFSLGIAQVFVERSGWTALTTALMFALALTLLTTRRPGLNTAVRAAAAALLLPSLAVLVICLGAQLLPDSASPVTLPVIATLVALVMSGAGLIHRALLRVGLDASALQYAALAIEASSVFTGVAAVCLALVREAAGLGTSIFVLLALGLGSVLNARVTRRRYSWWLAGISFTGAVWCLWGIIGVSLLEAYLLPPALAAALVAAILVSRGARALPLYAAGLGLAILPSLLQFTFSGVASPIAGYTSGPTGDTEPGLPWRSLGLIVAAGLLLMLALVLRQLGAGATSRVSTRARLTSRLSAPTFAMAALAAVAGPVQGIRLGLGADLPGMNGAELFFACLCAAVAGAVILALAASGMRDAVSQNSPLRTSRWLSAPAVLALAAGVWCGIGRDWFVIWAMWALMLVYLVAVVAVTLRSRSGRTSAPPVWFLFGIAFVTAIVAWSPRELRVEWFSLPLGAFLLAAGAVAMRGSRPDLGRRATLESWPIAWTGSWALLGPGVVTTVLASIVATYTDPQTWRAILVIVLALVAILVGAALRLAAPFIIGVLVLPTENILAFSVQVGRGIESMPWWITLAVVGAVLLIIAVTSERRADEADTFAARIRDLR